MAPIVKIGSTPPLHPLTKGTNGEHYGDSRLVLDRAAWRHGGDALVPFNAVLIREIGPLWVSAGRVSIGALGCWGYFLKTLPTDPMLYLHFVVLGVVGYVLPFGQLRSARCIWRAASLQRINALTPMTTVIVSQFGPAAKRLPEQIAGCF